MKIFTNGEQPQVSLKYQINFSEFSLNSVKVPSYDEYVGTIYMFVNNINNKVYIGQTITKFYNRFTAHFGDAFRTQDNLPFHIALRKYGWDNFSRYILWQSEVYSRNQENYMIIKQVLDEKEVEYIEHYSSNYPDYGYNATKGGNYFSSNAYTKEAIEKSRKSRIENGTNPMLGKTYDQHHLAVPILQYDFNKQFIKEWSCIKLAEDTLNIRINPKVLSSGGYFWLYKNSNIDTILETKYNLKQSNLDNGVKKSVYCFNLYRELVTVYESCGQAAKALNITPNEIAHAASKGINGNVVHEYIWIYEKDYDNRFEIINTIINKSRIYKSKYKPIYQVFLNGEIIKLWNSLNQIEQETNLNKGSISKCLNNTLNVYNYCFWIYEEDYSDDIVFEKLEKYKKTKKDLVYKIMKGELTYESLKDTSKLNTVNSKEYLKNNPCVYQLDLQKNIIKKWDNYKDIEKQTNWKFDNISKCLRGNLKTAYGYKWVYAENLNADMS